MIDPTQDMPHVAPLAAGDAAPRESTGRGDIERLPSRRIADEIDHGGGRRCCPEPANDR